MICNSCYEIVTIDKMTIVCQSCFDALIQQNQELKAEIDRLRELKNKS